MAINPVVFPKFPVIPLRDFIGIMQITDVPGALVVHPSVPVKSASELVAYLKANPGKLNYGSPGAGSANRLEMEMFRILTGTQMTHVPYKGGAGQAVTALLGNEVQTMFVTFTSVVSFVKQGRLRMLGVVSPERNPVLPDIPAMPELGFPTADERHLAGLVRAAGHAGAGGEEAALRRHAHHGAPRGGEAPRRERRARGDQQVPRGFPRVLEVRVRAIRESGQGR